MAPFGYLPFAPSRYLFILINTVAILIAWYLLLRMFKYTLSSVAAPALLLAMFCTETRHQHAGVHQHQRLRPAGRDAVLALAVGRAGSAVSGGPASRSG